MGVNQKENIGTLIKDTYIYIQKLVFPEVWSHEIWSLCPHQSFQQWNSQS